MKALIPLIVILVATQLPPAHAGDIEALQNS